MRIHTKIGTTLVPVFVLLLLSVGSIAAANVQISGTITDQSSNGIVGAAITITDSTSTVIGSTMSSTGGHYTLAIPIGIYTIQVSPPPTGDFQTITESNQRISTDAVFNFTFIAIAAPPPTPVPATLGGTLSDTLGNPLPNQSIQLDTAGGMAVITDPSGRFSFSTITGAHTLGMSGTIGFPNGSAISYVMSGGFTLTQNTTLALTLPTNSVAVHVQDPNGAAISNARVSGGLGAASIIHVQVGSLAMSIDGLPGSSGRDNASGTTDLNGDITLTFLTGTGGPLFNFSASPPQGSNLGGVTIFNVNITTSASVTLPLTAPPPTPVPATMGGIVGDMSGSPLANQTIQLDPATSDGGQSVITDSGGHFSFATMTGSHVLGIRGTITFSNGSVTSYAMSGGFTLSQDTTFALTLPTSSITVHVQEPNGAAVPNTGVTGGLGAASYINAQVGPLTMSIGVGGQDSASGVANGDGDIALTFLAGTGSPFLNFSASPPQGSTFGGGTVFGITITTDLVTIALVPLPPTPTPATLGGTLSGRLSNPLANQTIQIDPNLVPGGPTITTGPDGRFSFATMTGSHILSIRGSVVSPNGSVTSYAMSGGVTVAQDITLALSLPIIDVAVAVQDQVGAPIPNTQVSGGLGAASIISVQVGPLTMSTNGLPGSSAQDNATGATDAGGNVTLTLLTGTGGPLFNFSAIPPQGRAYPTSVTVYNVNLTGDTTEFFVLQNGSLTGSTAGGTQVTLGVPNYQPGTQFLFDGVPATNVTVTSSTSKARIRSVNSALRPDLVSVTTPPHIAGAVDVVIVKPNGLRITYPKAYIYATIAPASAPSGRAVPGNIQPGPLPPIPPARPESGTGGPTPPDPAPSHR